MKIRLKPVSEQTIVITGASSGIGLTTARMAAERGANVILVSRSAESLSPIVEELRADGCSADYVEADVGKREQIRHVVDTVIERHGGFDTWVNNAGIGIYGKLEDLDDEDHHRVFQTNYWGVVYGSVEALKHLRSRGGALINVGSISSDLPAPILSAYTASKFAVKGFTDSLRMELMNDKAPVSVTLIQPSGVHTPFGEHARNITDSRSQVPSPVYHPKLVARSILRSAESPRRTMMIGESGLVQTTMAKALPRLTDFVISKLFLKTALDSDRPVRGTSSLHEPGSSGEMLGDQDSMIHKFSPYTEAQIRPRLATGVMLGSVLAVGAMVLFKSRR